MRDGGAVAFAKAHACGNDFLIIDEALAQGRHAAMARTLCSRHRGVGADGIEFLDRRANGTMFLRLFNADGSEAELSGNGTRCVAAWLAESEARTEVELGTHGGVRPCRVVRHDGAVWEIESGMGVPRVMRRRIELAGSAETMGGSRAGEPIVNGPLVVEGAMVNVGNPHFVVFPEREDFGSHGMSWQELGTRISVDPLFRFGTNVEFVRVLADKEIAFRIVERGCGPTMSSGTGTCASAAAAMVLRGAGRELMAMAEGGAQTVRWPMAEEVMWLTGPAEVICMGEARFG